MSPRQFLDIRRPKLTRTFARSPSRFFSPSFESTWVVQATLAQAGPCRLLQSWGRKS